MIPDLHPAWNVNNANREGSNICIRYYLANLGCGHGSVALGGEVGTNVKGNA